MRSFSPYEKNHLTQYGVSLAEAAEKGEMPVEYMTGHVPFMGLILDLTQDVLIPRIETEELVTQAIAQAQKIATDSTRESTSPLEIADVGTGSGAIGISLALALTKLNLAFNLTLSDVSAEAVAVARQNWQRLVPTKATFLVSDLLQAYPPTVKYDLLVANLPYIPTQRIPSLDASVTEFEPHLALDGGPEGLSLIEAFLQQIESRIKPQGRVLLEMDYTHAEDILRLNSHFQGQIKLDSFGQARFAIFQPKP